MKRFAALLGCLVLTGCGGGGAASNSATPTSASIAGTVSGLPSGRSLLLSNSGTETIAVASNGGFTFAKRVSEDSSYDVTVLGLPNVSHCVVANGQGTVAHAADSVSNVNVTCSYSALEAMGFIYFKVGATVSGLLPGNSLTLMNHANANETVIVTDNGLFVFPAQYAVEIAPGAVWDVSVKTQPTNQSCTVNNGSGAINPPDSAPDFVNVSVSCK